MIKTFIYLVFTLLLLGCSANNQPSVQSDNKEANRYISKIDPTPNWILHPSKESSICSVGSASISDIKTSRTIALLNAKANISKEINLYIQTQSIQKTDCTTQECKNSFETKSSHQSTHLLKGVEVVDNYTDEKSNILYIRACCKI